jgi:DNA-binding NtrC family response regulator
MSTKGKLLIVDDNKSILSALEILLQDEFDEVKTIANPNQLPSLIESNEFDLVLLDMNFSAGVNTETKVCTGFRASVKSGLK